MKKSSGKLKRGPDGRFARPDGAAPAPPSPSAAPANPPAEEPVLLRNVDGSAVDEDLAAGWRLDQQLYAQHMANARAYGEALAKSGR